jgi:hypothetical protein
MLYLSTNFKIKKPNAWYRSKFLLLFELTAWSRAFSEKLTGSQLVSIFPALYGTRRFITAFTTAGYLSIA